MKKLLLLFLAMAGMVGTASAENVKIYFKPLNDWLTSNAWLALYVANDDNTETEWIQFTEYTNGIYVAEISETYTRFFYVG